MLLGTRRVQANQSHTASSAAAGGYKRQMVQIAFGSANRAAATLSVMNNTLPVAAIDTPVLISNYIGGSAISFSGSGADHED